MSELLHWVWFSRLSGLSAKQRLMLYESYQDIEAIFKAGDAELKELGLPEPARKILADKSTKKADKILSLCERRRISIVTYSDALYPERLNNITNPPWALYVKGRLPILDNRPTLAIVGTRKPSAAGLLHAESFARKLAERGMFIVSGMALGIDSAANRGALLANSPTIAVLGGGADVIYPSDRASRRLYSDIAAYGAIVSEYPPGTRPLPAHFPARNRIISGLSEGVLVIEGGQRSGALITARLAFEQDRMVFALPGRPGDTLSYAPNRLIKNHAKLVDCIGDILSEYTEYGFDCAKPEERYEAVEPRTRDRAAVAAEAPSPTQPPPLDMSLFSGEERAVLSALEKGRLTIDGIAAVTDLPIAKLMSLLTTLDMRDAVTALPGRIYKRVDR